VKHDVVYVGELHGFLLLISTVALSNWLSKMILSVEIITYRLSNHVIGNRIKFRHLHTFVEVARQKSVVKASEILNISQPAVTKTIRELEEVLGVPVLERGSVSAPRGNGADGLAPRARFRLA
jgi:hypothetical protein